MFWSSCGGKLSKAQMVTVLREGLTARYLDHLTNHQAVTALESVDLPPLATGSR